MTHPLPIAVPSAEKNEPLNEELRSDLIRDLGAETLLFICAIEAALGVQADVRRAKHKEETEQLAVASVDEAA